MEVRCERHLIKYVICVVNTVALFNFKLYEYPVLLEWKNVILIF